MSGQWNGGRASGTSARGNFFIEMVCTILLVLLGSEAGERLQTQLRPHPSAEVLLSSSIGWPSGKQWQAVKRGHSPGHRDTVGAVGTTQQLHPKHPRKEAAMWGMVAPKDMFTS